MNLQGKTAIVTGAARGIGQRYAMRMAEIGMNVIAADLADCSETVKKCYGSGRFHGVKVDVADSASAQKMVDFAVEKFGKVHVLVNNAAMYGNLKGGRIEQLDEAEWDACMRVNVKGVWNCSKAVIPVMRKQGGGSIVNIASLAAVRGLPYSLHYATSKGGVIAMTRSMARELGRDAIRVNAVAPTAVLTEGTSEFFGEKLEKAKASILQDQALKKNLDADDIVGTVLYLAGDFSKYVTGQTIMVDGGTHFL